ncbi:MAG: hypothetical protein ACRC5D_14150 [Aeromonas allosaccharophila]
MNFSEVHTLHLDFKRRLASLAGKEVFTEITVSPPKGDSDELSFIRLISWGYILVFESGRGSFNFLKKLPPFSNSDGPLAQDLHALRTWASHNLDFDKKRDIQTVQRATSWLISKCGTGSPSTAEHWRLCFDAIVTDLKNILERAISACDCFDKSSDRVDLIKEFQKSLDRNWDAYVFDEYVEKAFARFGYEGLSAMNVRSAHLDAWRKIIAASIDEQSIQRNITIRIENDVLNLMARSFPITSYETEDILRPLEKDSVTTAMLFLREKAGDDLVNVQKVLAELRALS